MASPELRSRRRSIESVRAAGRAPDPTIEGSWRRCREVVDTARAAAPVDCEPADVAARWEASPIRRSGVGVEEKLARAAEAGGLVAAVTDDEGRILWSVGSRQMRDEAEQVGFVPGGRWDEASAGTNALGLALLTGTASAVFSSEHWCDAVRDWVCWSVPIRTAAGRPIGVIDLSGHWDTASPVAELAVEALGRLVEEHLPDDVGPDPATPTLELRVLGHPHAALGGLPLPLSPRQAELLATLAIDGPATLDQLQYRVYGDRPVSPTTVKAELSHLRKLLGGGIASRPYRLTMPVRVDAVDLYGMLRDGDLHGAATRYAGQLLPDSESPFAVDNRQVLDVALRRSLLESGTTEQLLRFAAVHRDDVEVLQQAWLRAERGTPLRFEAEARLRLT